MCEAAPVASKCWLCVSTAPAYAGRVSFLGIVGDQAHSLHRSGHNCASAPGGQESPIDGVGYNPDFAHALDIGHNDLALAARIRGELLPDLRVRYVIDNGIGYYPEHRGGGTFVSFDHEGHLHVSFMPGTTFDIRPFVFGTAPAPIPTPTPEPDMEDDDVVIIRWKDGPATAVPLKVSGGKALTVDPRQVDAYNKAGVPVVDLDGDGARKEYQSFEPWRPSSGG